MRYLILLLLILSSITVAADAGEDICDYFLNIRNVTVGYYIPKEVPYSTEIFNSYTLDQEIIGHAAIEDKVVTSISCELTDEPTYNIYVLDLQTIIDIYEAESPVDMINEKLDNGDIVVDGVTIMGDVMVVITRIGLKILGLFV